MRRLLLTLALCLMPTTVLSVEPNEMLADPALEQRAREMSKGIRCPQCQNESIDESNASIAKDLRIILRERLTAGDTDQQAITFLVDRYGEFILFTPDKRGANLILWLAGPGMLVLGVVIGAGYYRRRKIRPEASLSEAEEARLAEILRE